MRKKHRAVFLDRDGTINVYKSYMWKIEDFEWIPGAKEGLQMLSKTDHKIVIVSNQSGVGRGYYTREDVDRLHNWMKKECEGFGVEIHAIYYCPHHPDDGCSCRKPNPGMIHKAAEELGLNLKKSWLIGDNVTDIVAGRAAGVKTIKIKNEKLEEKESPGVRPHRHVEDLKEGIEHLVRYSRRTLILKALLFVVAVGMPVLLWQRGVITKEGIFSFLESYPNFAPLLFIIITALGIALILPIAIIMGLGAGFFWGTWIGGLYAFFGLTLGTALGFFVSRYLAKDEEARYVNIKIWKQIEEEAFARPWRAVLAVRFCQVVPLGIGTYLFGVTRAPFWKFFGGTSIVVLPSAFLFAAIGDSIGGFVLEGNIKSMVEKGALALFGVCAFLAAGYFIKKKIKAHGEEH